MDAAVLRYAWKRMLPPKKKHVQQKRIGAWYVSSNRCAWNFYIPCALATSASMFLTEKDAQLSPQSRKQAGFLPSMDLLSLEIVRGSATQRCYLV